MSVSTSDLPANRPLVFDGHNDLALKLLLGKLTPDDIWTGTGTGHIDMAKARAGGFAGGFFAMFVPSAGGFDLSELVRASYDIPLPAPVPQAEALRQTRRAAEGLEALQEAGLLEICTSTAQIEALMGGPKWAAIMHLEGAEAIDPDFRVLEELYDRGLRSLGPVWSRPTDFGEGVPFRFPSDPDTGNGLTALGKELVRECNRKRIMIDLSHLNARGVEDVAAITDAPLVATHSNAWAECHHARNLTDRQLEMIAESDGMVGINFATAFLRPDGQMSADVSLDPLLRHFDHMVSILGEDRIGLGSDFDGAVVPTEMGDCAGLTALRTALRRHGVDEAMMEKLAWKNWMRVLRKTWGEAPSA
ncbi:membrane dipeptidase [Pseudooceanicola sp. CBS1P-1]|uniref:Peptidase M19 n=1 Tax=Pseudooceanicola albus TaxID=2692189 RepID=A0A6L7G8Z1_9RHOB|nr:MULTISPECIES: membrane dipeptidase [Pseudooceanicola]MBT9385805.1 membrane dipeptidase [Pseudooceanicola endophyticus]MXN20037.1 peptidase M19 [Pseudooceanicola albus]